MAHECSIMVTLKLNNKSIIPRVCEIRWVTAEVKWGDDPESAVSHLSPEISHSSLGALRGQPYLRMMSFKGDSTENYLWKYYIYMDEFLCDWQCHLEGFSQCLQLAHTACLHLLTFIDVIQSRYWKEQLLSGLMRKGIIHCKVEKMFWQKITNHVVVTWNKIK